MATSRVRRGRESQVLLADYLRQQFPQAESLAASLPGKDIKNTPSWAIEVKATKDFNPTEFLKQAQANAGMDWPLAVYRPRGYGPEKMDAWVAMMPLRYMRELVSYVQKLEAVVGSSIILNQDNP